MAKTVPFDRQREKDLEIVRSIMSPVQSFELKGAKFYVEFNIGVMEDLINNLGIDVLKDGLPDNFGSFDAYKEFILTVLTGTDPELVPDGAPQKVLDRDNLWKVLRRGLSPKTLPGMFRAMAHALMMAVQLPEELLTEQMQEAVDPKTPTEDTPSSDCGPSGAES